jgi:transcriptional regulator
MHGYGLARRIEQISKGVLELNQGTIYPALLQLKQAGWISAKWGVSENNRRARFYSITNTGKRQLTAEAQNWRRIADVIERFATPSEGEL